MHVYYELYFITQSMSTCRFIKHICIIYNMYTYNALAVVGRMSYPYVMTHSYFFEFLSKLHNNNKL